MREPEIWYYSATMRGFYNSVVHKNNLPEDALPIPDSLRRNLLASQRAGNEIIPDENGAPTLLDKSAQLRSDTIDSLLSDKRGALLQEALLRYAMSEPDLGARLEALEARATTLHATPNLDPDTGWPE